MGERGMCGGIFQKSLYFFLFFSLLFFRPFCVSLLELVKRPVHAALVRHLVQVVALLPGGPVGALRGASEAVRQLAEVVPAVAHNLLKGAGEVQVPVQVVAGVHLGAGTREVAVVEDGCGGEVVRGLAVHLCAVEGAVHLHRDVALRRVAEEKAARVVSSEDGAELRVGQLELVAPRAELRVRRARRRDHLLLRRLPPARRLGLAAPEQGVQAHERTAHLLQRVEDEEGAEVGPAHGVVLLLHDLDDTRRLLVRREQLRHLVRHAVDAEEGAEVGKGAAELRVLLAQVVLQVLAEAVRVRHRELARRHLRLALRGVLPQRQLALRRLQVPVQEPADAGAAGEGDVGHDRAIARRVVSPESCAVVLLRSHVRGGSAGSPLDRRTETGGRRRAEQAGFEHCSFFYFVEFVVLGQ
eukprot:Rhum_TRINITY_DN14613_c21_g1::Rhum_TRINITY_DN14613_c21_g1_i1::g.109176::m.109176